MSALRFVMSKVSTLAKEARVISVSPNQHRSNGKRYQTASLTYDLRCGFHIVRDNMRFHQNYRWFKEAKIYV